MDEHRKLHGQKKQRLKDKHHFKTKSTKTKNCACNANHSKPTGANLERLSIYNTVESFKFDAISVLNFNLQYIQSYTYIINQIMKPIPMTICNVQVHLRHLYQLMPPSRKYLHQFYNNFLMIKLQSEVCCWNMWQMEHSFHHSSKAETTKYHLVVLT